MEYERFLAEDFLAEKLFEDSFLGEDFFIDLENRKSESLYKYFTGEFCKEISYLLTDYFFSCFKPDFTCLAEEGLFCVSLLFPVFTTFLLLYFVGEIDEDILELQAIA